jgi:hypothetical protein
MPLIARFSREEFLTERWDYRPGQHVSLIAPTQNGKTTMVFDLLRHTDTSWCSVPPVMLVAKPRDPVVSAGLAELRYREIKRWPPKKGWFSSEGPPGYALWPPHLKNVETQVNDAHLAGVFRPALRELFWKGNTVTVADEVYHLTAVLGLSTDLTRHWTQGAGMGSGLWSATQKPSGTQQGTVPSFMYNSPTHTFLGRDPDKRNRERFGEIGGVDPKLLSETVLGLRKFEWLYIHRDGPTMCIVEA